VLVDQRGTGRAVANPVHEFPEASPGLTGQGVASMPQVVEVDTGSAWQSLTSQFLS
jgi:hypothetical protein